MSTGFDHDFRIAPNTESDLQSNASQRLLEDSFGFSCKQPMGTGSASESSEEAKSKPSDGKKPPAFEIVDEKDAESKREAAIKEIALNIKNGKFDQRAKEFLLEALNTGDTDAERRKSLNNAINSINKELTKAYKESGEKDPSKLFELRFLNVKGADGTYDKLRIGLQSRRSSDYNDSFLVRVKK